MIPIGEIVAALDGLATLSDTSRGLVFSTTSPRDDEADQRLAEINAALAPLGLRADWTGTGNTDEYGYSSDDLVVGRIP